MMSTNQQMPPILLEKRAAGRKAFGLITLNRPRVLNAFNHLMAQQVSQALADWAKDDDIAFVILHGAGPKGLCAGGDVRRVVENLRSDKSHAKLVETAGQYFETEYRADYAIHTFPKPLLAWGHGLVFGGGWGLFAGASHRVATPSSQFSMPEILIGLFPDVAASWFLNKLPHGWGLFLGMTASRLNARDAWQFDLADHILPEDGLEPLMNHLQTQTWHDDCQKNSSQLHQLLAARDIAIEVPARWAPYDQIIRKLSLTSDLASYSTALAALDSTDPKLAKARAQYLKGSPTSAALIFHFFKRTRHLSLEQCFMLDWQLVMHCSFHHDFREGIRALLIDKDQSPQWQARRLEDVDYAWVETALSSPFPGLENPLNTLAEKPRAF